MCDVREWGDGAAAVSGWSKKGGERKILGGWIQTRGLFCRLKAPVCLEQMDYCLLSPGEWVLRIFLVPRVAHSLSHTSPLCLLLSLGLCYTLFCLLLFCGSLCISLLLTFSHTKTDRLFSLFFEGRGSFFSMWVVLCCLRNKLEGWLWQGKNAESSCSSLFGGCPSLRTECKDHHINHQPSKQAGKKTAVRQCSWLQQEP